MAKENQSSGRGKVKVGASDGWCPWRCELRDGQCVVSGYVKATALWQTIAVISGTPGAISDVARLVELVNGRQDDAAAMRSAFVALKTVEEEGFTFATEMELEDVIQRLENAGPMALNS